ncbi:hypothetical protein AB0M97_04640 [Streptomyces sp. NPDC051207]|uniref:hypothetical protein n=1 Tax=Streptomyces sp. NPDC051207 TaxID=3154641 RepID=UPI003428908B
MGIRMLHRRTAPAQANAGARTRVPLPPSAATASTVRVPATFTSALRCTAEDLRRRLTPRDPALRAMALGDASRPGDPPLWRQWTNLALGRLDLALRGSESRPGAPGDTGSWRQWADLARTLLRSASRPGETPPWRQWTDLVRGYLALALAALPRPRPVQTVTVFVAAPDSVTGRPYGPAPHRRRRDDRRPGPDATA